MKGASCNGEWYKKQKGIFRPLTCLFPPKQISDLKLVGIKLGKVMENYSMERSSNYGCKLGLPVM